MPKASPEMTFPALPPKRALLGVAALAALVFLFMPYVFGEGFAPLIKAIPIWILAVLAFLARDVPVHRALALALVFSGFGDLLMSLSFEAHFAAGMGAFLLAQLTYIVCFWSRRRNFAALSLLEKVALGGVLVWSLGLGVWLLPLAGVMAPALVVYFGALSLMVLLALGSSAAKAAKVGALLFFLSDSLIGIDRFVAAIPERHLAIMGSYYLAQALLFWGLMRKPSSADG